MATKKLELGKEKCFQIHVGKNSSRNCPDLSVHEDTMNKTTYEKYLGDIIANDGTIDKNIEDRKNKGIGRVNSVMSLLEEISFGDFHFEMALLFRNSMLVNSLLSSSEVLYNVEKRHIDELEKCDKDLMTRIFGVPFTCSYEAFYLETGIFPIRFILQGRRIMYYWTLLNKSNDELAKKFFDVQKQFSSKNDWIIQVRNDMDMLKIEKTENEIKLMKKDAFKKLVKEKINESTINFLLYHKSEENRSKIKNLTSFKLQNYLRTTKLSKKRRKSYFFL